MYGAYAPNRWKSICAFSEMCTASPIKLQEWYEENKTLFAPPICNKLMHKNQMTVMFVGGPNKRRDFHLDCGSEFFFMFRGGMRLPTIQRNKLKIIDVYLGAWMNAATYCMCNTGGRCTRLCRSRRAFAISFPAAFRMHTCIHTFDVDACLRVFSCI